MIPEEPMERTTADPWLWSEPLIGGNIRIVHQWITRYQKPTHCFTDLSKWMCRFPGRLVSINRLIIYVTRLMPFMDYDVAKTSRTRVHFSLLWVNEWLTKIKFPSIWENGKPRLVGKTVTKDGRQKRQERGRWRKIRRQIISFFIIHHVDTCPISRVVLDANFWSLQEATRLMVWLKKYLISK